MNLIVTILAFVFALGLLIAFHELGHYLAARLCNVKVLRFSIGMGKVVFLRRWGKDQTEWVISALPFGGYVKMLDLRDKDGPPVAAADLTREFTHQSVWKRISIVVAGPLANFLLAILILTVLYMVGVPEPMTKLRQPEASTPAAQAGIHGGERVIAVNGEPVKAWPELRWKLVQLVLDKQTAVLTVVDGANPPLQIAVPSNQLSVEDLQGDFLSKLGLQLALSKAQLGQVKQGGAAARAGLAAGDTVLEINGKKIVDSLDLMAAVRAAPNQLMQFRIERAGVIHDVSVTPDAVTENGQLLGKLNVGVHSVPEMQSHPAPLLIALQKASEFTWNTSVLILKTIGKMVMGEVSLKNLSGPLTIADYAGQSAKIGWISYFSFIAFISISLGVMNLLPIPVLDGGHLLYYALEILAGRPIPLHFWEVAQRAGVAVLILLMAFAFVNDIVRLFL